MLRKGGYRARMAESAADLEAAQRLRHRCFIAANGAPAQAGLRAGGVESAPEGARDADRFDALCRHVLVEDLRNGRPVCCFRLLPLAGGSGIAHSYAAQFYGLAALERFPGRLAEIGRFCIDPRHARDPDILRLAWGAITRYVDAEGIAMLFGCASFQGIRPAAYLDAFAMLRERHLAPRHWRPGVKAPEVVRFEPSSEPVPDLRAALRAMPPLLRSYLGMGGWVSDHAVVDRDMNTLHVFTGLEIAAVPPSRARALRAVAGQDL